MTSTGAVFPVISPGRSRPDARASRWPSTAVAPVAPPPSAAPSRAIVRQIAHDLSSRSHSSGTAGATSCRGCMTHGRAVHDDVGGLDHGARLVALDRQRRHIAPPALLAHESANRSALLFRAVKDRHARRRDRAMAIATAVADPPAPRIATRLPATVTPTSASDRSSPGPSVCTRAARHPHCGWCSPHRWPRRIVEFIEVVHDRVLVRNGHVHAHEPERLDRAHGLADQLRGTA